MKFKQPFSSASKVLFACLAVLVFQTPSIGDDPCPPHDVKEGYAAYPVNRLTIVKQTWKQAHNPSGNPNLLELQFGLNTPISVDGIQSGAIQISVRPPDNPPRNCQDQLDTRGHYWQQGYFHFVETTNDQDYPKCYQMAKSIDFKKQDVSIRFNPKDMPTTWYELIIKDKAKPQPDKK